MSMRYDFEHLTNEVNANILRQHIIGQMEDTETPEKVRDYLLQYEGKKLTKRHSDTLTELIGHTVTIRKQYGMTYIDWDQPDAAGETKHFSMLLAYGEVNVEIPGPQWFVEYAAREISAAHARNNQRQKILDSPSRLSEMASAIVEYRQACQKMRGALDANWDDMTVCGDNPDDWNIKRKFVISND